MTLSVDIPAPTSNNAAGISFLRRDGNGSSDALPLLLLHGVGSHGRSFEPLMKLLPAAVSVIAWNAPGYAGTQPLPMDAPRPNDYAAALLRLIDALGLARIVLVGHSLGCLFAASFAAQYPSRTAALALLSPALGYRVTPGMALPPTVQARVDDIYSLGVETFAAKRSPRLVYEPERKPEVAAGVRQAMAALNPAGYAQAVRALGAGDLLADAARITAPTVVAIGAEDVVTPLTNARSVYAVLANKVAYHEIAATGHALPQENPAAVADLLLPLIERHDG